jgi:hypothetical protein
MAFLQELRRPLLRPFAPVEKKHLRVGRICIVTNQHAKALQSPREADAELRESLIMVMQGAGKKRLRIGFVSWHVCRRIRPKIREKQRKN